MASRSDVEARLHRYAREYDRRFPSTALVESRIMARVVVTPRLLRPVHVPRRKWALAGVVVRQLAMVCVLLVFVGVLVVGVTKLRALPGSTTPKAGGQSQPTEYFSSLHFVSPNEGWIAESGATSAGPTVLYRTTDGGHSWQRQLTWDGPGPAQVRFSSDGAEGVVVGRGGVPLFSTTDGGEHWQRMALPPPATQADLIYFLDAREGWDISYLNEATPGFAGVFHTADAGQHWTQTARLDVNQQFSYGLVSGGLPGSLMFHDSSTGWLSSYEASGTNTPMHLYVTHNGGKTWSVQTLESPAGVAMESATALISLPQFVSERDGILVVTILSSSVGAGGVQQVPTLQGMYVYSTTDAGAHWTTPQLMVLPRGLEGFGTLAVVDASNWVILANGEIVRTRDGGRHWEFLAGWLPANEYLTGVEFQSAGTAWAEVVVTGAHPALAIYRTTDGGAHWSRFSVPDVGR